MANKKCLICEKEMLHSEKISEYDMPPNVLN